MAIPGLEHQLTKIIELEQAGVDQASLPGPVEPLSNEPSWRTKEEVLDRIRAELATGETSIESIANTLKLAPKTVCVYGRQLGYHLQQGTLQPEGNIHRGRPVKLPTETRLIAITQALAKGERSLEELCKLTSYSPRMLRRFCAEYDIDLPQDLIPYKYRPEIDRLIEEGWVLQDIGDEVGLTYPAIQQYIAASGQHELWERAKERKQSTQEKDALSRRMHLEQLDVLLRGRLRSQAKTEGWAYEKAVDYFNARKIRESSRSISLFVLVDALKRYESAQELGERRSLENLAEGLPLTYAHFGRVLNQLGLKPLSGDRSKKKKEEYKDKPSAILRASELDISSGDMAYFLDVSPAFVDHHREDNCINPYRGFLGVVGRQWITYRLASQIYEAKDAGFTPDEIPELLDASVTVVSYALKQRSTFEVKIIDGLRVLYDKPALDKPYKIR